MRRLRKGGYGKGALAKSSMDNKKNQYGRKTWDVDAYARVAKERREGKGQGVTKISADVIRNFKKENILRQAVGGGSADGDGMNSGSRFGEDNSWFKCQVCRRRFKDSLKLTEHLSSKMHRERLKELDIDSSGESGGSTGDAPVTLERVKQHLTALAERKGR